MGWNGMIGQDGPPGWRVIAASVVGTSHRARAVPCQDAQAYRILADGTLVVAVADGAGSAARAEAGAACAVARAVAAMVDGYGEIRGALGTDDGAEVGEHSPPTGSRSSSADAPRDRFSSWGDADRPSVEARGRAWMAKVFGAAREGLEDLAIAEWEPRRAFACTLTCAVATADGLLVGQIGDGVAVARGADGELFAASRPQKGEYANEASFLTMDGALDQMEVAVFARPIEALAVTTDGLLRLALELPRHVPHAPFFRPLLRFADEASDPEGACAQLATFLASERICRRTDDDKTLVIAVRARAATATATAAVPGPAAVVAGAASGPAAAARVADACSR